MARSELCEVLVAARQERPVTSSNVKGEILAGSGYNSRRRALGAVLARRGRETRSYCANVSRLIPLSLRPSG